MDGAEAAWDLDDPTLASFMSCYAPVPEHLRKRKNVAEEDDRSEGQAEVSEDADVAGEEENPGIEDDNVLEPDPSDDVLMRASLDPQVVEPAPASAPRTRRRLVRGGVPVVVKEQKTSVPGESALNIPVSCYFLCNAINVFDVWVGYKGCLN